MPISLFRPAPLVAALLAFVALSAEAAVYSNRSTFSAQLTNVLVDDYQDPAYKIFGSSQTPEQMSDAQMSQVRGETTYTTTGHQNVNFVFRNSWDETTNFYCAGCNGSFVMDFTGTSIADAKGVYGVGFDYFNLADTTYGMTGFHAFVTHGDGSHSDIALPLANYGADAIRFFGITSDLGIRQLTIGLAGGAPTYHGVFGQSTLTLGQKNISAVPEPETGAMIALALAIVGGGALRKRATGAQLWKHAR